MTKQFCNLFITLNNLISDLAVTRFLLCVTPRIGTETWNIERRKVGIQSNSNDPNVYNRILSRHIMETIAHLKALPCFITISSNNEFNYNKYYLLTH